MKYIPRINEGAYKDALVDIACALATGEVEIDTLSQYVGTDNLFTTVPLLTSNIRPTNGSTQYLILQMDDDDVVRFVPTEGKAKQGNLFVAVRDLGSISLTSASNADVDGFLNDIRQVLDSANIAIFGEINPQATLTSIESTSVVVWGYLKETQTEDYNPLSVISTAWIYKMFNPAMLR